MDHAGRSLELRPRISMDRLSDACLRCLPDENRVFHRFSELAVELRLQIWETAVRRERLIRISLKPHVGRRYELAAAEPRYLEKNHLGKPISGERYRAVVEGRQLNSKLLSVNREAREVANWFYRVHIPVYLTGPTVTMRTTLLFNPEHDFLHIEADAPVKETLLDFLWDLRAYDPKDIGLLKLAVDLNSFGAIDMPRLRKCDICLIRQRTALVSTLSQLKSVWFINTHTPKYEQPRQGSNKTLSMLARAPFPVMGGPPTLERVGADPRHCLEMALRHVYMGEIDPRELIFRWRRTLRYWEVEHDPVQVEYRVALATTSETQRHPDDYPRWPTDDFARALVHGLWLFPVEALGEIKEGQTLANMNFETGRELDLREYWPELVLAKGSHEHSALHMKICFAARHCTLSNHEYQATLTGPASRSK